MTEDYVSFETAKLLKEKGFEYNPDESYWLIDANNKMYWISCIGAYDYVDVPTESFQRPKNGYRLVTQAMTMKWLREVHKLHIILDIHWLYFANQNGWMYTISRILENGNEYVDSRGDENDKNFYPTYEEACEAAIKYCLENLI